MASLLGLGCGGESPAVLAFVGLTDAPCAKAKRVHFGSLPVLLGSTGQGTLQRVVFRVNEGLPSEAKVAPFLFQVDTTKLKDGTARLSATGYTTEGDETTTRLNICVDNLAPSVTVLSPADGAAYGLEDAALTVRVRASDTVGLERITAKLLLSNGSTQVSCAPPGGPDATCALSPAKLGIKPQPGVSTSGALVITARDKAGHEAVASRVVKLKTRLLWSFNAGSPIRFAAAEVAGGKVAVGTGAGKVHIVDAAKGTEACVWTAPTGTSGSNGVTSNITTGASGTQLYFTTVEGLHAVGDNCKALWSSPAKGLYYGSQPLLDATAGVVYVGAYGGYSTPPALRAHKSSSGKQVGSFNISTKANTGVASSPVLAADRKTVFIGSTDKNIYAVDVSGGAGAMKKRWSFTTAGKVDTRPLVAGTRIYVASYDAILHALDATTGQRLTGFTFKAGAPFLSSPVLNPDGSALYVGSLDEYIYALDSTGKKLGSHKLGRMLHTSPVVGGSQVFAAATKPARLHVYGKDLTLRWYWQPSGTDQFQATPLLIKSAVYIGNSNGFLYALDVTSSGS